MFGKSKRARLGAFYFYERRALRFILSHFCARIVLRSQLDAEKREAILHEVIQPLINFLFLKNRPNFLGGTRSK